MLQEGEILPLGNNKSIKVNVRVNVRVISATDQSLENLVMEKQFLGDLLKRLNMLSIYVPCLKDRIEDIPLLVQHFIQKNQAINPHVKGL